MHDDRRPAPRLIYEEGLPEIVPEWRVYIGFSRVMWKLRSRIDVYFLIHKEALVRCKELLDSWRWRVIWKRPWVAWWNAWRPASWLKRKTCLKGYHKTVQRQNLMNGFLLQSMRLLDSSNLKNSLRTCLWCILMRTCPAQPLTPGITWVPQGHIRIPYVLWLRLLSSILVRAIGVLTTSRFYALMASRGNLLTLCDHDSEKSQP